MAIGGRAREGGRGGLRRGLVFAPSAVVDEAVVDGDGGRLGAEEGLELWMDVNQI